MTLEHMIGTKWGKLTVLREGSIYIHVKTLKTAKRWMCVCECGNTCEVRQDSLRSGNTKSCGCIPSGRQSNGNERTVQ